MSGLWKRPRIIYVERNIHGAWVICGEIGIRQYYFYTKKEAVALYREACHKEGTIINRQPHKPNKHHP